MGVNGSSDNDAATKPHRVKSALLVAGPQERQHKELGSHLKLKMQRGNLVARVIVGISQLWHPIQQLIF